MSASIRAVAYYRMSDDCQETSIPDQRAEVVGYAARTSYTIVRDYQDEGISGDDTEHRYEFQRMIQECARLKDVETILCWDQDRFGRFDPLDAGFWVKPLRDAGIRLETVADGRINWDDFAGRLMYVVRQEGKHAYLRDLSRNVIRGQLRAAKAGKWMGGPAPYGYDLVDGILVPGDPAKVATVRWIFETYATRDIGVRALAGLLNERCAPAADGGKWNQASVANILRYRVYVGDLVWNRRHLGSYHGVADGQIEATSKRSRKGKNPSEDWEVVEGAHEAIIDRELFERVQTKMTRRRKSTAPRVYGQQFALSGLLVCGHCGYRMFGVTNEHHKTTNWKRFRRYICGGYHAGGKSICQRYVIDEAVIVAGLVKRLTETIFNPATIEAHLDEIRETFRAQREAAAKRFTSGDADRMRDRVVDLDKQIATASGRLAVVPDSVVPILGKTIEDMAAERRRIADDLHAFEGKELDPNIEEQIKADMLRLSTLRDALGEAEPGSLRTILAEAVEKVELWFEPVPDAKYGKRKHRFARGLIHPRVGLRDSLDKRDSTHLTSLLPTIALRKCDVIDVY